MLRIPFNKHFFAALILSSIGVFFVGGALAVYGPFQDSEHYFTSMVESIEKSPMESIQANIAKTGKIEPFLPIMFWFSSKVIQSAPAFIFFYFSLVTCVNLYVGYRLNKDVAPFDFLCISLSYWIVSVNIYFWKASLAYALLFSCLIYGIKKPAAWLLLTLSILTHLSSVVFLLLYLIVLAAKRMRLNNNFTVCLVFMSILLVFILTNTTVIPFASQGDITPYMPGTHTHSTSRFLSYALLGVLLYQNRKSVSKACRHTTLGKKYEAIWILCVSLLLFGSATIFTNYHASLRLALPAMLFGPFLFYRKRQNLFNGTTAILILSTLPTFWLAYKMFTGNFNPE